MACRHYCSELNPDTAFEVHNINITTEENKQKLKVLRGPRLGVGWGGGGWGGLWLGWRGRAVVPGCVVWRGC